MKQFYNGMAAFLQMMVDQNLKAYGAYQHPLGELDRETYEIAYANGFIDALKRVNEWLDIAIKEAKND